MSATLDAMAQAAKPPPGAGSPRTSATSPTGTRPAAWETSTTASTCSRRLLIPPTKSATPHSRPDARPSATAAIVAHGGYSGGDVPAAARQRGLRRLAADLLRRPAAQHHHRLLEQLGPRRRVRVVVNLALR